MSFAFITPFPLLPVPHNQHSILCCCEIGFFFFFFLTRALVASDGTENAPTSPPRGGAQPFPGLSHVPSQGHRAHSVASVTEPALASLAALVRPGGRHLPSARLTAPCTARAPALPTRRAVSLLSKASLPFESVPIGSRQPKPALLL